MITSILEGLEQNAISYPDKNALIFENEQVTYKELWEDSLKLYSYFVSNGIKEGDRVVVQSVFSKWFFVSCFATWLCHAVFCPIDQKASTLIIEEVLKKYEPVCAITGFDKLNVSLALNYSILPKVVSETETVSFTFPSENEYACIASTTGTTGNPKGIIWTHKNLLNVCISMRESTYPFSHNTVHLTSVPLNHAALLWKSLCITFYGGTCILVDSVLKLRIIKDLIKRYGVNSLFMPPAHISIISRLSSGFFCDVNEQIKVVAVSTSNISSQQITLLKKMFPFSTLVFIYGSSESGYNSVFFLNSDSSRNSSCVGKPCLGVDIKILDENFQEVKSNTSGTIAIKSKMTFGGYWKNPELTEKHFWHDYYLSDDVGYFDDNGNLYVLGRKDDVINIGGLKVYPTEIENQLTQCADISECICIAVPDNMAGKALKLLAVKKNDSITSSDVIKYLSDRVDSYKIPKYVEFVDSIKRTENGKLDRKAYQIS